MKSRLVILVYMLFIIINNIIYAQNTNYGYSSGPLIWSSHTPVRASTNILSYGDKVFYVGTNNKICEYYWNSGSWSGGGQLEWGPHYVKSGTQIANKNYDVFFVNSTDSRVYMLRWTSLLGWTTISLNPSSVPVRNGSDIVVHNDRIFYVGTNNKVCEFITTNNGISWQGGYTVSVTGSVVNVLNNTQLKPQNNKVYYIGTNNLVCEYTWTGMFWLGGQQLDWSGNVHSYVKSGTELCTTENNGIFHISANNNLIYNLAWTSTSGWTTTFTQCYTAPRASTDMISIDNHVFFVGNSNGKIYDIEINGTNYNNTLIHSTMPSVNAISQLKLTYNDIYIAGTNNTFKSYQITYLDNARRINYCIYDYLFNAGTQQFSTNPIWHHGKLNTNASSVYYFNTHIANYNKQFFFVGNGPYVNTFLRSVLNSNSKPNYTLTWDQNFDVSDPNLVNLKSNWNSQLPHGSGPRSVQDCDIQNACQKSYFKYYDNCSVGNGILSMANKNENYSAIEWGEFLNSNSQWYWLNHSAPFSFTNYNYTSASITTGMQNMRGFDVPPNEFAYPYPNGGAETPEQSTFNQLYGWYEIRCKVPRGKNLWSAFWMLQMSGGIPPEIDIFEIGGDGGSMKCSDYITYTPTGQVHFDEIAVGYRFYDDYYTYALKWTPNSLKYYLNNELVYTITNPTWIPNNNMYLIVSTSVDIAKSNSELSIYPNYMDVDYVRAFSDNNLRIANLESNIASPNNHGLKVYPNPTTDKLNFVYERYNYTEQPILEIYNIYGSIVFTKKFNNNKALVYKDNVKATGTGVYFYKVRNNKGVISQGKVTIH